MLRAVLCSSSIVVLCAACGGTGTPMPDGGNPPTCAAYCDAITANCVGGNNQYSSKQVCLDACKAMPVGKAADTSGNTLGCRAYHAGAAKSDPATHCVHAGPGGAGACGANCDGYCQIATLYCTSANQAQIYTDLTACKSHCAAFPDTAKFYVQLDGGVGISETKDVACLLYHVSEATQVPADHCNGDLKKPADGGLSDTCNQ